MGNEFIGKLEGKDSGNPSNVIINIDADAGSISSGGFGKNGSIILSERMNKKEIIRLGEITELVGEPGGSGGQVRKFWGLRIKAPNGGGDRILLGRDGDAQLGGHGVDGDLTLRDMDGKPSITIGHQTILLKNSDGTNRIKIGNEDITIRNSINNNETIHIFGNEGNMVLKDKDEIHSFSLHSNASINNNSVAGLWIGATKAEASIAGKAGKAGAVFLRDTVGNDCIILNGIAGDNNILVLDDLQRRVFAFVNSADDGRKAGLFIGAHADDGGGKPGTIAIRDFNGKDSIFLDGLNGDLFIKDDAGRNAFALTSDAFDNNTAALWIGAPKNEGGKPGMIVMRDDKGRDSITLDGLKGDIFLNNADCAEEFDVDEQQEEGSIEPGSVMVIDENGMLRPSLEAYDKRVVGVISGAGDFKPGIILDKKYSQNKRMPVALVGKVNCKVDASYSQIEVGDLLTTSFTPGHAMKGTNPSKSFGAVIGKALKGIESGKGLIPILIALQ